MIIGITGKSGSGKNYIVDRILALGQSFYHIDIDKIGHQALENPTIKKKISEVFGDRASANRKELAEIVFNNRANHKKLADISWEFMEREIDRLLGLHKHCILNWILLPHTKYFKMCDTTILVERNEEDRISSIMMRDGITKHDIELRDKSSISYEGYKFSFKVHNIGG